MSRNGIEQYLGEQPPCQCGHTHACDIEHVFVCDGALSRLPPLLRAWTDRTVFVVSDANTETAAGSQVKKTLSDAGVPFEQMVFSERALVPDETAVGRLLVAMPKYAGAVVAVGTGTLNDLCRFAAYRCGVPYCIVATAASMDGFASNAAPLIVDNLKTTFELGPPRAIVADLSVLAAAPAHMTAAGAADVIAKCVALADWRLSEIVTGEEVCESTESLLERAAAAASAAAPSACLADKTSLQSLMNALVLSGVAINYIGNTRPASGSEHHLSHYWEMMSLLKRGTHGALHGEKVGVGTLVALDLYKRLPEWISRLEGDSVRAHTRFQRDAWEGEIARAYGPAAKRVILLEKEHGKNTDAVVLGRRASLVAHLKDIRELVDSLPDAGEVEEQLMRLHLAVSPVELGVTREEFIDAVRYAKDLRIRYGLLQALFDLGVIEEAAQTEAARWYPPQAPDGAPHPSSSSEAVSE